MLIDLSTLTMAQSSRMENTAKALNKFLNCYTTHPGMSICFHASPMILCIHSDTSYHLEPQAQSHAGGYFYLGNHKNTPNQHNGPVLAAKVVLPSAGEDKTGGIFNNMKEGTILQTTLDEMGHPNRKISMILPLVSCCSCVTNSSS